jgi:hypothetical protein
MDPTSEAVKGYHAITHAECSTCKKKVCLDFDCMCSEPGAVVEGKVFCQNCVRGAL